MSDAKPEEGHSIRPSRVKNALNVGREEDRIGKNERQDIVVYNKKGTILADDEGGENNWEEGGGGGWTRRTR